MASTGTLGVVTGMTRQYCRRMYFTPAALAELDGPCTFVKKPGHDVPPAQRDPAVIATVSEMLSAISANGMDAVLKYAEQLDNFTGRDIELGATTIAASGDPISPQLRQSIELGAERTKAFAEAQRAHLSDFEIELVPGLVTGQRYIPIQRVG